MRQLLFALVVMAFGGPALAGAMPAFDDLLADCSASTEPTCAGQQKVLAQQWTQAMAGDYLALRNFAFCFSDGCYGAVKVDQVKACAFRIVVVASRDPQVTVGDRDNFDRDCNGTLTAEQQQAAKVEARTFFQGIFRRGP